MRWSAETPLGDGYCTHLAVEDHHPVADPWRRVGVGVLGLEGESAAGDHLGEPVEHLDVGALELARLASERRRRLLGQHGDDPALVTDECPAPEPVP